MDYNKKDLVLLNMKQLDAQQYTALTGSNLRAPSLKIFKIETDITTAEKIAFIDKQADGIASYLLNLFDKWNIEKEKLPKDNYGRPKTVSTKAWLHRNDTRHIICGKTGRTLGSYFLFGRTFKMISDICPTTKYGYALPYTGKPIAEQWFHDLLVKLYHEEKDYFEQNSPFMIKLKQIKIFGEKYNTVFNSQELNDIVWNNKTDVSEENIDAYIDAYERLESTIGTIETKLHNQLNTKPIE